jgi:hypothetical protein
MQNATMPERALSDVAALQRIAVERLAWSRGLTQAMLADLTDEQLLVRAGAGRAGNHAIWIMGHLAVVDDNIASVLDGGAKRLPDRFRESFAMNTEPASPADVRAARAELTSAMASCRERIVGAVESLTAETAFAPAPERMRRFAPDRITAAFGVVAHEMLHAGQLSTIRAALALPKIIR